ncbi:hypothetical protein [Stratiformator vulcanicus]|uniref:Uncharacterized protein n=1 Tax=Stratiformator vulcanicus TaxID=2527980 RepID=A0A517R4P8_9PLAN|nr:hypothetical protein [Stratiformator vulcanicus]QDT38842.1 hypothetical protein Pan189_32410 [Stratiformator vulcanicus]
MSWIVKTFRSGWNNRWIRFAVIGLLIGHVMLYWGMRNGSIGRLLDYPRLRPLRVWEKPLAKFPPRGVTPSAATVDRTLAVIDGRFDQGFTMKYYIVNAGSVVEAGSMSGWMRRRTRTPFAIDGAFVLRTDPVTPIGANSVPPYNIVTPAAKKTETVHISFGRPATPQGGGDYGIALTRPVIAARQVFHGYLGGDREYLLYVEGDRPFIATRAMSVEQFAKSNPGSYLVVTISGR